MLEHVGHIVPVEGLAAGGGVVGIHFGGQLIAARDVHPEPAVHPQHGFDDPLHVVLVGGGHVRCAVNLHVPHGDLAVGALHGHIQGLVRSGQEGAVELCQRDKTGVQLGNIFDGYADAEMIHDIHPPFQNPRKK